MQLALFKQYWDAIALWAETQLQLFPASQHWELSQEQVRHESQVWCERPALCFSLNLTWSLEESRLLFTAGLPGAGGAALPRSCSCFPAEPDASKAPDRL